MWVKGVGKVKLTLANSSEKLLTNVKFVPVFKKISFMLVCLIFLDIESKYQVEK